MADSIRINGNAVSYGSIRVKFDGETFYGFTELTYGHKRERTYLWGMNKSQAPRGRSRGKYIPDPVKLKGPKSSCEALRTKLALRSPGGDSYGDTEFMIVAQYVEAGEPEMHVQITNCVIAAETETNSEGSEVMLEELEIMPMRVFKNGRSLYSER
jgi:hypothetical protein